MIMVASFLEVYLSLYWLCFLSFFLYSKCLPKDFPVDPFLSGISFGSTTPAPGNPVDGIRNSITHIISRNQFTCSRSFNFRFHGFETPKSQFPLPLVSLYIKIFPVIVPEITYHSVTIKNFVVFFFRLVLLLYQLNHPASQPFDSMRPECHLLNNSWIWGALQFAIASKGFLTICFIFYIHFCSKHDFPRFIKATANDLVFSFNNIKEGNSWSPNCRCIKLPLELFADFL